jgi:hypothetical protein
MLKIITSVVVFASGLVTLGAQPDSAQRNAQQEETRAVSTFNKIDVTDGIKVVYTKSDQSSLKVVASDGIGLSALVSNVSDGILTLMCKGNGKESVVVYLSSPQLVSVKARRAAEVALTAPLETTEFNAVLASRAVLSGTIHSSGAALLKGKTGAVFNVRIESPTLDGYFFSGTKANLSGVVTSADIVTQDNAFCNARNFGTKRIKVSASDTSTALINATNAVDVAVTDAAKVNYFGTPRKLALNRDAVVSKKGILIADN